MTGTDMNILQIPDLLSTCRQRLLAQVYAELQAQAFCVTLLGLPLERSSTRDQEIG